MCHASCVTGLTRLLPFKLVCSSQAAQSLVFQPVSSSRAVKPESTSPVDSPRVCLVFLPCYPCACTTSASTVDPPWKHSAHSPRQSLSPLAPTLPCNPCYHLYASQHKLPSLLYEPIMCFAAPTSPHTQPLQRKPSLTLSPELPACVTPSVHASSHWLLLRSTGSTGCRQQRPAGHRK